MDVTRPPTCAFLTLGCKVNQHDTEALKESFRRSGYRVVPFTAPADVYVVNTCAVTAEGQAKSRRAVRRARARAPGALVAAVGCYPQVAPDQAGSDGADLVVGTDGHARLPQMVHELTRGSGPVRVEVRGYPRHTPYQEMAVADTQERTRATLKVQDGCDLQCSYCLIPRARGPARSREPEGVRREAARLVQAGHREIVLVGICLGAYGADLQPRRELADAVQACLEADGRHRVRLSSVEVTQVTPRLVNLLATEPRLCRHLAVPLQSGSGRILQAMGRGYAPEDYTRVAGELFRRVPGLAITTDVMVGFPGETEEDFLATCGVLETVGLSRLHVFRYSARPGTPAASLPGQVPGRLRSERARHLLVRGRELAESFRRRFIGETLEVLAEGKQSGCQEGLSDNYVRLGFAGPSGWRGRFVSVRVVRVEGETVRGVAVGEPRDSCEGRRIG
ncbi:MAG: tRNA (N(6)-L-threonylcarbamoyladenosine(37)-C(2))-methylthiotransferase MtaB [bacterium]|nr:tRNA (N(6)-L-threonylcarbamoyladenosine(37)-C(2))-methylthiotransferase MtaB [bacterium]